MQQVSENAYFKQKVIPLYCPSPYNNKFYKLQFHTLNLFSILGNMFWTLYFVIWHLTYHTNYSCHQNKRKYWLKFKWFCNQISEWKGGPFNCKLMADTIWVSQFIPESKHTNTEWRHINSPPLKKIHKHGITNQRPKNWHWWLQPSPKIVYETKSSGEWPWLLSKNISLNNTFHPHNG